MRTSTPVPDRRRRVRDTTPSIFEGKLTKVGDIQTRSVFCLFPKEFIIRHPETRRKERVRYWLETIGVNGQACV